MPKSFFVEVMGCHLEIVQDDDGKFIVPIGFRGLGGALKPAFEPALLFRKPLAGTAAENVLAHGTGALNIDGCRVGNEVVSTHSRGVNGAFPKRPGETSAEESGRRQDQRAGLDHSERVGRFPSNVIHDGSGEVLALFPDSDGAGSSLPRVKVTGYGGGIGTGASKYIGGKRIPYNSGSGSAARFFYCPKASKKDREDGNDHPTVKPTDLMRYLCRLVTPAGGVVLDPFMGSGSTGKAAILEGFGFVGIEREINYVEIAQSRIARCLGEKQEKELRPVVQDLFAEVD